jgi:hypothetical protein
MVSKLLAWLSLATAVVFAILALVVIFGGGSLLAMAPMLILWIGLPLLAVSILLALGLLVTGMFQS